MKRKRKCEGRKKEEMKDNDADDNGNKEMLFFSLK